MNGYERYVGIIKGEKVDYLPRLPILMAFAAKFIGSNYGAFASDYRVLVEANLKCCEFFGIDQLNTMSDPYRETQGFGAEIEYVRDGVPKCPHPPLEERKDFSILKKPDPLSSERMVDRLRAVEEYKKQAFKKYSIMGWVEGPAAEAADVRGVTNFLIDLIDDEKFACDLMDRCIDAAIPFAEVQVRAGADTIGIGDAIASQVSSEIYQELIYPREKILIDAIHNAGAYVRLHICGNITHLLPDVAKLGVDVVDIDSMVDISEARKILGQKTPLMGNLDPANMILRGKPEKIVPALREIYHAVGNPYMTGAGCEIPEHTPHENLKALCALIPFRS
jgi:MtaA/CmuA family methyltransferase